MDYFGWSIWTELLMNDKKWLDSLELKVDGEFEPDEEGWDQVFNKLEYVLNESGLIEKMGGCFHSASAIPSILNSVEMEEELKKSTEKFKKKIPFEFGMHSTFSQQDLVLSGNYPNVLKRDVEMCSILGGTTIVEHPPTPTSKNVIKEMVEELTSEPVMNVMRNTDIMLSWENMLNYKAFYAELKNLIEFRNCLQDKLNEMGEGALINQHVFCLDTGHLLAWRAKNKKGKRYADRQIEEFLPIFAEHLKVFHIHSNDGRGDNHLPPFSLELFDLPSRKGVNKKKFVENSERLMDWLRICKDHRKLDGLHWHLECLKLPFKLTQFVEFAEKLRVLLY